MKRHFIRLLSVIILFFTVDAAFAQLGVELIGDEIVGIIHEPVIRHGLLISNDTSSSIHVQLDAELPRGFKALLLPEPMDIMPGSKKIVLFAVQATDTVPAGIWEYRYRVTTSPKDGEIIDKIIKVTVPARPALMLRVLDGPDFVLAGQKYETAFELTNRGNVPMAISLEPFSSDESSITIQGIEKYTHELAPGEVARDVILVETNSAIKFPVKERLGIIARSLKYDLEERGAIVVEVIPEVSTTIDPYYRSLMKTTLRTKMEMDNSIPSKRRLFVESSTSGFIDREQEQYLDVSLEKGMDLNTVDFNSQESLPDFLDQYSLKYKSNHLQLDMGYLPRTISPLIQQEVFSRGISGQITLGPLTAGAYYQDINPDGTVPESAGGFISAATNAETERGEALYMVKTSYYKPSGEPELVSFLQTVRTRRDDFLTLEAAASRAAYENISESEFSVENTAFKGNGMLTTPGLRITASGFLAGSEFSGTRKDSYRMNGQGILKPFGSVFFLAGDLGKSESNITGSEPESDTLSLFEAAGGMGLSSRNFEISGKYQHHIYQNWKYDDEEKTVINYDGFHLKTRLDLQRITLGLYSEFGQNLESSENIKTIAQEYGFSLKLAPISTAVFTLNGAYNRRMYDIEIPENHFILKAGGTYNSDTLSLNGSSCISSPNTDLRDLDISSTLGFSFQAAAGTVLAFSASHTVSNVNSYQDNSHEFVFDLSFTKSLGFKTGRKKEFGSVQGYVVSENGEPGEGVLLRLGDYAAVSDSKGSFYFPAIPTGRAQLTIDQESMGASFRPRQEMPLTLDILPAETKQVKIEFIKSARIEGRVIENTLLSSFSVVQKSLAANSQKEQSYVSVPGKFRKILLTNGFVTRWTITDSRGAFNFGDLPSGRWVLHVPELEDQGSFRLDNFVLNHEKTNLTDNSLLFFPDEQKGKGLATLNINEGDSIQIELSHLPPIPRVKMIESGSLISVGR